MGKGSDHLQLIKCWPSCAPWKGVCGRAIFLAPPYYIQCAMFASLWALLSFHNASDVLQHWTCLWIDSSHHRLLSCVYNANNCRYVHVVVSNMSSYNTVWKPDAEQLERIVVIVRFYFSGQARHSSWLHAAFLCTHCTRRLCECHTSSGVKTLIVIAEPTVVSCWDRCAASMCLGLTYEIDLPLFRNLLNSFFCTELFSCRWSFG